MRDTVETKPLAEVTLLPAESPPFSTTGWTTDFSKRIVKWSEILSGGPPKDGIPAIDQPMFDTIADSQNRVAAQEPVIVFEHNGEARAYPLSILMWHEIVNDEVGGKPRSSILAQRVGYAIAIWSCMTVNLRHGGSSSRARG